MDYNLLMSDIHNTFKLLVIITDNL